MKKFYLSLVLSSIATLAQAQEQPIRYQVEAQGIYNSDERVPFWFRSNQFGSVPLEGASGSFLGKVVKDYDAERSALLDWGFGLEGRANLGKEAQGTLIEAYGKLRLGIFQLKAGRSKEISGLVGDSLLSSGSFSISGTALGVPQVSLSIPEFYTIPVFNGMFAIKGNFAHGWLGTLPLREDGRIPEAKTYFHQSSFYGRIGKPEGHFKVYGGFNHQAFWGNYSEIFSRRYEPISTWQEFIKVVTGQKYNGSKVGNHTGSIDLAAEYEFPGVKVKAYRQHLYEIGALAELANLRDGLNGLTFTNLNVDESRSLIWKKLLLEVFYTKNQAGEAWSKTTESGAENYYNNYQYDNGWSYYGLNLGSPFITDRQFARDELAGHPTQHFINNRLFLMHLGFEGAVKDIMIRTKLSYSRNYGTFRTSAGPYRLFEQVVQADPNLYFTPVNQFSFYLEGRKAFRNNVVAGLMLAGDNGRLLYNSAGVIASISKSF
jgi:hypothetical protein